MVYLLLPIFFLLSSSANPKTTMNLLEVPKKYYYAANGHEYIIAEIVEGVIPQKD